MLKLEHVGIAVETGTTASSILERLFGVVPYKTESVDREGVDTFFIDAGGPKLELLESVAPTSAIAKHLIKRGGGLHHLAVEVDDIHAQFARIRGDGFTVLSDAPLDGADGKQIFFVHPKDCLGILVEFCQQVRPTWRLTEIEMPHGTLPAYSAGSVDAVPVLLLHDQGSTAKDDFNSLVPSLEQSMHVIAFDAPGHGGARGWDQGTSILRAADKHARAVLAFFQIERPAIIVGRGLASEAAVRTAQSYPDLAGALVLVDPDESLIPVLEETGCAVPTLVCSLNSERMETVSRIFRSMPDARLSVIPEMAVRDMQLAQQIVAVQAWI